MRIRTVALLLFAVLLAGSTAMLARSWLAAQRSHTTAEAAPVALPPPVRSVLVAHAPIERGQILKPSDFAWQPWPDGGIDKAYILLGTKTPESFTGWVARYPMTTGEPVTAAQMVAPGSRGFLAAVLRPGMRAVSVPVNATTGISGFVFPGDLVDIVITYPVPAQQVAGTAAVEHKASETILRDVRVIGIDQRLESKPGEAVIAHTATLEVTPKDAEMLNLATEMGKLSLSLRSLAKTGDMTAQGGESQGGDSSLSPAKMTYTLDSEISPLLPKPLTGNDSSQRGVVTILRGNGKGGESVGSPPASRGS
jgi:pilus assembly protein CpaB